MSVPTFSREQLQKAEDKGCKLFVFHRGAFLSNADIQVSFVAYALN
jgi:hypothetical protein